MCENELKPCPFCGGMATYTNDYGGDGKGVHCCYCMDCGAGTCFVSGASTDDEKKQRVIDYWNRRVEK